MRPCSKGSRSGFACREWGRFIRDPFARLAVANEPGSPKGKRVRDLGSRIPFPVRGGLPKAGSRGGLLGKIYLPQKSEGWNIS